VTHKGKKEKSPGKENGKRIEEDQSKKAEQTLLFIHHGQGLPLGTNMES